MKVLLICSGGMSSSLMSDALTKAAQAEGVDLTLQSTGSEALETLLPDYDMVLVAPQIRHRFDRFAGLAEEYHKPIMLIDSRAYGLLDGPALLQAITSKLRG